MELSENLRRYIDAGFPLIYLNSFEEGLMDRGIKEAIEKSGGIRQALEWNGIQGLVNFRTKKTYGMSDNTLAGILRFLLNNPAELDNGILLLKDSSALMGEPEILALLRGIAVKVSTGKIQCTVIIESAVISIPKEIEPYMTILEPGYLTVQEIKETIQNFAQEAAGGTISTRLLDEMAVAFKGLPKFEIENILALAYQENGQFTKSDMKLVFERKRQTILKSGMLEMVPIKEGVDDIGGLENLKGWLKRKAVVLKDTDRAAGFGVDIPKGVLIAGVPGCGKSLNAKAAASLFGIPLLRMDIGRLMGKYVGESEANMRRAIKLAEAISPCVLWVDELEKAFSGIGGDGGGADVATRLFGNFLTWLQEKESTVFVVATANNITKLPPELMRKGRFDEIFYVGLPKKAEREKIFEIHIRKRRSQDLTGIDIPDLASRTDGYSGADIEGVVKESIEKAYTEGKSRLKTGDILMAIQDTHPLKEVLGKSLEEMKKVYEQGNFKSASK